MGEIINLHIGGCGNRIGYEFYELIAREHSILPNGKKQQPTILHSNKGKNDENIYNDSDEENYYTNVFFSEGRNENWIPRAILADFDYSQNLNSLSQIHDMKYGKMFHVENSVFPHQGAGGNWARGHYTLGAEYVDEVMDIVRKQVENCENLQGFQFMHSLGGNSGSGWGTLLLSKVREEYPDKIINTFSVFPSNISKNIVEPYNCVLGFHQLIENSDFVSCFDNDSFLMQQSLNEGDFSEINRIIARVMSDVTCSFRFPTHLGYNLRKLSTNLIPFPRFHFGTLSHCSMSSVNVLELFQNVMEPSRSLCGIDMRQGRFMTAIALFRGGMTLKEVNDTLSVSNNNSSNWVDWIPNNLKYNICKKKSSELESVTLIGNSTSTRHMLKKHENRFDNLFKKRAYLNYFIDEGMEEMEFLEAHSNLNDIMTEYESYENSSYE